MLHIKRFAVGCAVFAAILLATASIVGILAFLTYITGLHTSVVVIGAMGLIVFVTCAYHIGKDILNGTL